MNFPASELESKPKIIPSIFEHDRQFRPQAVKRLQLFKRRAKRSSNRLGSSAAEIPMGFSVLFATPLAFRSDLGVPNSLLYTSSEGPSDFAHQQAALPGGEASQHLASQMLINIWIIGQRSSMGMECQKAILPSFFSKPHKSMPRAVQQRNTNECGDLRLAKLINRPT